MTAQAASRAGAGMVTLAAPAKVWSIYATSLVNAIVRSFDGLQEFEALLADARRNVIALGPGAGVDLSTRQYVLAALATKRTVVLDADALTSLAESPLDLFDAIIGPCVLTPHAGEFMRLFHFEGDKLQRTRCAARQCNAVVLLKGPDTVIAAPDGRAIVKPNAPAQLATGGSGDVLTGFVAALLAQGMAPFEAAAAAVWLHGAAATEYGLGLVAEDLPMPCRACCSSWNRALNGKDMARDCFAPECQGRHHARDGAEGAQRLRSNGPSSPTGSRGRARSA